MTDPRAPDEFELYDLAVVVERIEGHCTCDMRVGDWVELSGGKLAIAKPAASASTRSRPSSRSCRPSSARAIPPTGWRRTRA